MYIVASAQQDHIIVTTLLQTWLLLSATRSYPFTDFQDEHAIHKMEEDTTLLHSNCFNAHPTLLHFLDTILLLWQDDNNTSYQVLGMQSDHKMKRFAVISLTIEISTKRLALVTWFPMEQNQHGRRVIDIYLYSYLWCSALLLPCRATYVRGSIGLSKGPSEVLLCGCWLSQWKLAFPMTAFQIMPYLLRAKGVPHDVDTCI